MNREIKFRIWDKKEKNFFLPDDLDTRTIQAGFKDLFNNENYIPQQFTGLKDGNGKKIFEGDIIELCGEAIVFRGQKIKEVKYIENSFQPENIKYSREIKIIGNIFKNPDLIK